jgi:hypothetical protein
MSGLSNWSVLERKGERSQTDRRALGKIITLGIHGIHSEGTVEGEWVNEGAQLSIVNEPSHAKI